MPDDWKSADRAYRIIDSIYRLHRDLFEIENSLVRMATLAAGLLALVPILISLGDIKWNSSPAVTIYCLAGAVLLLWIFQWMSAGKAEKKS